jgi:hypothetical protein
MSREDFAAQTNADARIYQRDFGGGPLMLAAN